MMTSIHDIDANYKTIYACGDTNSDKLTGYSQVLSPIIVAFDIASTSLDWGFIDAGTSGTQINNYAWKIALSPNGLFLVVLYDYGYLITMKASDGAVISGKKWDGGHDSTHPIMKSLLINSLGNAAYALVYGTS